MTEAESPTYPNLAMLREALRSDDEDRLNEAYTAVYDAGLRPSDVLGSDPPTGTLVENGVLPSEEESETQESLLKDIRDILESAHGGGGEA